MIKQYHHVRQTPNDQVDGDCSVVVQIITVIQIILTHLSITRSYSASDTTNNEIKS